MILRYTRPGQRFQCREMPELCGTLVKVNDCRAVVRWDRPPDYVHIITADGREAEFERPARTTSVTPYMEVTPL